MKAKLLSMAALMCVILAAPAANAQGLFGGRSYAPVGYSNYGYRGGMMRGFNGYGGYGGGYGGGCGWHHHRHHRRWGW